MKEREALTRLLYEIQRLDCDPTKTFGDQALCEAILEAMNALGRPVSSVRADEVRKAYPETKGMSYDEAKRSEDAKHEKTTNH